MKNIYVLKGIVEADSDRHLAMVIEIRVLYLQVKELQVLLAGERNKE